jgi:hypothetical protein
MQQELVFQSQPLAFPVPTVNHRSQSGRRSCPTEASSKHCTWNAERWSCPDEVPVKKPGGFRPGYKTPSIKLQPLVDEFSGRGSVGQPTAPGVPPPTHAVHDGLTDDENRTKGPNVDPGKFVYDLPAVVRARRPKLLTDFEKCMMEGYRPL